MSYKKIEEVSNDFWENQVNKENKMLINDFLSQQHLSPKTLKQYTSALKIFAKWVHDNYGADKEITSLKSRDGLRYQNWLIGLDLSASAIKFKRSSVSTLCNFIELYYSDEYPKFRNIFNKAIPNVANVKKKEKVPLTRSEVEKLVKELEKRKDWQKLAYLLYTFATGCRREESRQLLKEVSTYKKFVNKKGEEKDYYVTHEIRAKGKGKLGKVRRFQFDQRAMDAINKWLEVRGEDDCPYLFTSKRNGERKQISENTFNLWCKTFSEILGKKVHPHLIRSTRATISVVEDGKDIKSVQTLLGHESSQTTEIYVVRDTSNDLDDLF